MDIRQQEQYKQIGVLMKDFVERAVDFYLQMPLQPVCRPIDGKTLERLKGQEIPQYGRSVQDIYSEMLRDVYSGTLLAQHPRSFSCIPSTASLLSWMGDVMTNAYNPHASCQINAPAADLIEKKLVRWMCEAAGYPESGGGLFVSGGSVANLTALTAARDARLKYSERSNAVVYVSDQTHSSVSKGLHIIGFCRDQIHTIPTDSLFRMDIPALHSAVKQDMENGKKPFAVVASAGTTNTGSVDPMKEVSAVCREHGMWMHVDGAFGASALLSDKCREKLAGIEQSDSLSWDAHKWLLQTYGCNVVLVRDQSALVRSFAAHPEYLKDAEASKEGIEAWDLGPELTRPARHLKLWLTLQAVGSREIACMLEHGCAMAELAEKTIRQAPDWEIVSPAQFGIVNFRYTAGGRASVSELDRINQEISREITAGGFAQVFTTELRGRKVLRMCTIHPETTEKDIYDTIEQLINAKSARYQ